MYDCSQWRFLGYGQMHFAFAMYGLRHRLLDELVASYKYMHTSMYSAHTPFQVRRSGRGSLNPILYIWVRVV